MWSALGPDGDRNEQICQIICHELPPLALGLSYIQALSQWKQPKDADFISSWASSEKISIYPLSSTTFNLRGPGNVLPDETGCPVGC